LSFISFVVCVFSMRKLVSGRGVFLLSVYIFGNHNSPLTGARSSLLYFLLHTGLAHTVKYGDKQIS
jgi:hypothetical protein